MVRAGAGGGPRRSTIVGFALLVVSFVFGHVLFPGKHGGTLRLMQRATSSSSG